MQIRQQKEKELAEAEAKKRLEEEAAAKKRAEEAEALKPKPKGVATTGNSPTAQPISKIVWPADRRVVRGQQLRQRLPLHRRNVANMEQRPQCLGFR